MNRFRFYLHYALRSLRRDGTRTLLAGLSVAFGVLSLVAMQSLSNTLLHGAMFDQQLQLGGDMQIMNDGYLGQADLDQITAWQEQGLIAAYTPLAEGSAMYLRTPTSGRVTLLSRALGIDPASYPLTGDLVLRDPAGVPAADVLRQPTDALITRDVADPLGLQVGDSFMLGGDATPVQLTVAGIVEATPDQHGGQVMYTLATARLIEKRDDVITAVSATLGSAPDAEQTLIDSPYHVFIAGSRADVVNNSSGVQLFDLMLKGAGVLGLLVGGLSVANTLQVILARRKLEIAMLKTFGYQRGDLLSLIALETGLIGIVGGVVGALIGTVIAGKLFDVLGGFGTMLLSWSPDPLIVGGGIAAGLLTAVVFGIQAILASSATRPVELLRDLPTKTPRHILIGRLALYGLLLLIFGLLVGVVLGDTLTGVELVAAGSVALLVLRAIFWLVLWIVTKLPTPPTARAAIGARQPAPAQNAGDAGADRPVRRSVRGDVRSAGDLQRASGSQRRARLG